jgi:hypothetical protein
MNVRLQKNLHFTAGVWYDNVLQMNNYMSSIHLYTNTADPVDQNIAFERLKYFVYYALDSSILVDQESNEQCSRLASAGLKITTMPGIPVDQLIGIMLYYKLNAVVEQRLIITDVEISSGIGDNIVYLHNENESSNDFVKPAWWTTSDPAHCDSNLCQFDNVVAINRACNWRELELHWPSESVVEPGNIVAFPDRKRNDTE